ncbi:hypothetical protein [Mycoplasma sp. 3686d]|uniref:hypothetical protein n=1 Tax=Mycoplasma sp. 3686d TaxID=2967300 RepID=UPI00211C4C5F|nr:hypothetical protein [Mycoplasma sp. 3686d]UUM24718.1 hypothetical protein NPA12_03405 [Mycoplasma sp. 3686d]
MSKKKRFLRHFLLFTGPITLVATSASCEASINNTNPNPKDQKPNTGENNTGESSNPVNTTGGSQSSPTEPQTKPKQTGLNTTTPGESVTQENKPSNDSQVVTDNKYEVVNTTPIAELKSYLESNKPSSQPWPIKKIQHYTSYDDKVNHKKGFGFAGFWKKNKPDKNKILLISEKYFNQIELETTTYKGKISEPKYISASYDLDKGILTLNINKKDGSHETLIINLTPKESASQEGTATVSGEEQEKDLTPQNTEPSKQPKDNEQASQNQQAGGSSSGSQGSSNSGAQSSDAPIASSTQNDAPSDTLSGTTDSGNEKQTQGESNSQPVDSTQGGSTQNQGVQLTADSRYEVANKTPIAELKNFLENHKPKSQPWPIQRIQHYQNFDDKATHKKGFGFAGYNHDLKNKILFLTDDYFNHLKLEDNKYISASYDLDNGTLILHITKKDKTKETLTINLAPTSTVSSEDSTNQIKDQENLQQGADQSTPQNSSSTPTQTTSTNNESSKDHSVASQTTPKSDSTSTPQNNSETSGSGTQARESGVAGGNTNVNSVSSSSSSRGSGARGVSNAESQPASQPSEQTGSQDSSNSGAQSGAQSSNKPKENSQTGVSSTQNDAPSSGSGTSPEKTDSGSGKQSQPLSQPNASGNTTDSQPSNQLSNQAGISSVGQDSKNSGSQSSSVPSGTGQSASSGTQNDTLVLPSSGSGTPTESTDSLNEKQVQGNQTHDSASAGDNTNLDSTSKGSPSRDLGAQGTTNEVSQPVSQSSGQPGVSGSQDNAPKETNETHSSSVDLNGSGTVPTSSNSTVSSGDSQNHSANAGGGKTNDNGVQLTADSRYEVANKTPIAELKNFLETHKPKSQPWPIQRIQHYQNFDDKATHKKGFGFAGYNHDLKNKILFLTDDYFNQIQLEATTYKGKAGDRKFISASYNLDNGTLTLHITKKDNGQETLTINLTPKSS